VGRDFGGGFAKSRGIIPPHQRLVGGGISRGSFFMVGGDFLQKIPSHQNRVGGDFFVELYKKLVFLPIKNAVLKKKCACGGFGLRRRDVQVKYNRNMSTIF